jgi:hypothetical protein
MHWIDIVCLRCQYCSHEESELLMSTLNDNEYVMDEQIN